MWSSDQVLVYLLKQPLELKYSHCDMPLKLHLIIVCLHYTKTKIHPWTFFIFTTCTHTLYLFFFVLTPILFYIFLVHFISWVSCVCIIHYHILPHPPFISTLATFGLYLTLSLLYNIYPQPFHGSNIFFFILAFVCMTIYFWTYVLFSFTYSIVNVFLEYSFILCFMILVDI